MDKASEAILSLKPVTFHYKKEIVADRTPQFGLVAEDVEKVNPDLVVKDRQGNFYSVRYDAVNAMLLNEFLKEHRKVQELELNAGQQQKHFESALAKQERTIIQQQKQIEALTTTVRKVSERVELTAPAPQIAANND
jgi:predicted ribosome quality control (RQC) complex YloA/Tae2 family protein